MPASPNCFPATEVGEAQSILPFIYMFLRKSQISLGHLGLTCHGEPFILSACQETEAVFTMLSMAVCSFQAVWLRKQSDSAARD